MKQMEVQLVLEIKSVLTPDLLKPEYVNKNKGNPMYGHCYAATEALYHLLGGKKSSWYTCWGKDDNGITHWWLSNSAGEKLDPTVEQYTSVGLRPPYTTGKRGPFLTQLPSKRAKVIIARVERQRNRVSEKTLRKA